MPGTGSDASALFEALLDQQRDRSLPPVEQWAPEREGRIDIRIARDGTWYHEGDPIRRQAMVRLFSTILRRDGAHHYLVTPVERLAIEVEDTPLLATHLDRDGEGPAQRLLLTTNTDDRVLVDAEHPLVFEDVAGLPHPTVLVRGGLRARLSRPVYYEVMDLAEPSDADPSVFGVWSCGEFFTVAAT